MIQVTALLFCTGLMAFFIGIFYAAFSVGGGTAQLRALPRKHACVSAFVLAFIGFCFSLLIISQNRFIYYWDYRGYWFMSIEQMQRFFTDPRSAFAFMYSSINTMDYNLLLPSLLSLPLKIFGVGFTRYVLLNYVIFLVPTCLAMTACCVKILNLLGVQTKTWHYIVCLCLSFAWPASYYAMFAGYVDVATLLPSALLLLLMLDYTPTVFHRRQALKNILIALLLLTMLLFRRYFAYYLLGFVAALTALAVGELCIAYRAGEWKKALKAMLLNYMMIGGISLGILLVFFRELFLRALLGNYAAAYAAYNSSAWSKLMSLPVSFGLVAIVLWFVSVAVCFWKKRGRKMVLFLTVFVVITSLAFFGVQGMGNHHRYLISNQIFMLAFIGLAGLWVLADKKWAKALSIVFAALYCFNFGYCYVGRVHRTLPQLQPYFAAAYYPMQRNDIVALHDLVNHLNELTAQTNEKIYVAASGTMLNCDILRNVDQPATFDAVNNLIFTADIDLRDGFPDDFTKAGMVVATQPIELHAAPGTQEVVRYLAQEVMDKQSPIGRHFVPECSYQLDNGVMATIYLKTSEYTTTDLQTFADYYTQYYPGKEDMFANRILNTDEWG